MKHFIKAQAKLLVTVLTLVVVLGIGATVAYLHDTTDPVTNTFDPAQLDTKIEETVGTDGTKQVMITNTGKSDAYVRARIMVSGIDPQDVVIAAQGTSAEKGKILLVMPNAGVGANWQRVDEPTSKTYSDAWYYFCNELPGSNNATQAKQRTTSALLEKVYFGEGVNADEITITITHESVLAIPSGEKDPAKIEAVFNDPK